MKTLFIRILFSTVLLLLVQSSQAIVELSFLKKTVLTKHISQNDTIIEPPAPIILKDSIKEPPPPIIIGASSKDSISIPPPMIITTTSAEDNQVISRYQSVIKSLEKWRWLCAGLILLIVFFNIIGSGEIFQALIPGSMWWVVNSYIKKLEAKIYDLENPYLLTPNNSLPINPLARVSLILSLIFLACILISIISGSSGIAVLGIVPALIAIITGGSALSKERNKRYKTKYNIQKSKKIALIGLLISLIPMALLLLIIIIALITFA